LQRFILRDRKVSKRRMRLYHLPTSARDGGDSGDDNDNSGMEVAVGLATAAQVNRAGGSV
jgi:hypothetical protein